MIGILRNKYFLWAMVAAMLVSVLKISSCKIGEADERLDTYKRQTQGQLSEKERELQDAHKELDLLNSQLLSAEDLAKIWQEQKEETDESFAKFAKKHKLKIKSMDRTIASLKQQIEGGITKVVLGRNCSNLDSCVIKYTWEDLNKRFKLTDPNIFEQNNETFESNQLFKIYGEVWQQKNGSLLTKRLVLREVTLNEDGEYEAVPNGKADIVLSEFKYSNPPTLNLQTSWKDVFKMRALAIASASIIGDPGAMKFGVGLEFLQFKGMGINTHIALDFKDINKWEPRVGLSYTPKKLNLGFGASVGTPFAHMFNDYSINLDLLFYLTK